MSTIVKNQGFVTGKDAYAAYNLPHTLYLYRLGGGAFYSRLKTIPTAIFCEVINHCWGTPSNRISALKNHYQITTLGTYQSKRELFRKATITGGSSLYY